MTPLRHLPPLRAPRSIPPRPDHHAAKVEAALGAKGEMKDGVLRFTFGETTRMHGETAGAAWGVNAWAALAGSDD